MKIIVKRDDQSPEITIDLNDVIHTFQLRRSLKMALDLDGYTSQIIKDVFNEGEDVCCKSDVSDL